MTTTANSTVETLTWTGCYGDSWRDYITPESFAHPAKFARGLVERILTFGLERGLWRPGSIVGDPFSGIGSGGLMCAYHGLRWVGVELEAKFVQLAQDNIALHRFRLTKLGCPLPVMLQGDSRQFARMVGECAAIVTSPPFSAPGCQPASVLQPGGRQGVRSAYRAAGSDAEDTYGTTPGQIGALPAGDLDAVVTSPPFVDSTAHDPRPCKGTAEYLEKYGHKHLHGDYGHTEGQIGALPAGDLDGILTSPPYAECISHGAAEEAGSGGRKNNKGTGPAGPLPERCYGHTEGQIGALPAGDLDAVVTSPPYEGSTGNPVASGSDIAKGFGNGDISQRGAGRETAYYGATDGQIGHSEASTYWHAVAEVYAQCCLALKPDGVLCVVIKDYVRDKARVPLCDQTCTLLAALGFNVFLRVHASLTETTEEPGLFGEPVVEKKERKSFFRRLAEKKGSPRIDFEEVIFARKVGGGEGPPAR